ncbi:MAG: response regulator [Limisphaerales bacterium]
MKKPVIYVEDEEDDAIMMQLAWKRVGIDFPLVTLCDGQQALDYFNGSNGYFDRERHPLPCLLLLDLNLPRMNGLEVLKELREKFDKTQLPIVIFSSSDAPKDRRETLEAGANTYIVKPSGLQQLNKVVASLPSFVK